MPDIQNQKERAAEVLEQVNLGRMDHQPNQLSGVNASDNIASEP
jgi:predicted ABC-type transport system involved in lysophospholipase L1 biosynthesis ATPase subunit